MYLVHFLMSVCSVSKGKKEQMNEVGSITSTISNSTLVNS